MNKYYISAVMALGFMLGSCGSGPKIDRKNPPTGGTRSEYIYQLAVNMADQGYCAKAMPVFVCLASQGEGWEVSSRRAGQCATLAASQWQPLPAQEKLDPAQKAEDPLRRGRRADIQLYMSYASSPENVRAEGFRQLRRAAIANWPDAQAELIQQLTDAGTDFLPEAKVWLIRYDANPRRKIYGGDAIEVNVRQLLNSINVKPVLFTPSRFVAEELNEPQCDRLLGIHRGQHSEPAPSAIEEDGLQQIEPDQSEQPEEEVDPTLERIP